MSAITMQASCVMLGAGQGARALLIEGEPGTGKSSLALALIDRGAVLVGDDGVVLTPRGGRLWASPPPNIAGKLEIRNVGIVELPTGEAPVALIVSLDEKPPRYRDEADSRTIAGVAIPQVSLWPGSPVQHLRAEWALKLYGLT